MDLYIIPYRGKYLIYRPLLRLAFLGNAALARYLRNVQNGGARETSPMETFLTQIGFWDDDPPPPTERSCTAGFHPHVLTLLMGGTCNLRCSYCYASGGDKPHLRMRPEVARLGIDLVVANAMARNPDSCAISFHGGGEPTQHWEALTAIVDYARRQPIKIRLAISTNGVLRAAHRQYLLDQFDSISISFDGLPEVQREQRPLSSGGDSTSGVMATLHALDRAEKSYGLRMTVTMAHLQELTDSIRFICENTQGTTRIQCEPCFLDQRGQYQDPTPSMAEAFVAAFLDAAAVGAQYGIVIEYSGARPHNLVTTFCQACFDSLIITPEGELVTCYEVCDREHILFDRFHVGSVVGDRIEVDQARLQAFWQGETARRATCRDCFCYWHCGGDCAPKALMPAGEPRGRCLVNRQLTAEMLVTKIVRGGGVWRAAPHGQMTGGTLVAARA